LNPKLLPIADDRIAIIAEKRANHNGKRFVLFLDGSVRAFDDSQFDKLKRRSFIGENSHATGDVYLHKPWKTNPMRRTYRNKDTNVTLRPAIAAFRLVETESAPSGRASLGYEGQRGFVVLYHQPRAAAGYVSPVEYVQDACRVVEKRNGNYDYKTSFSLRYESGRKIASGRGVAYHFPNTHDAGYGKQIWEEFGAVQIGAFYFSYHGVFWQKHGLDDLRAFLRAIDIRKVKDATGSD
jgi:hypothetical protein